MIHASELVSLVRATTGDHFDIAVAAYPEIHPEAEGYDRDIHFLKEKLDAGANSAVTQYFYNVEAYFYFLDRCAAAGITQPIHPGIMPITNFANLQLLDGLQSEIHAGLPSGLPTSVTIQRASTSSVLRWYPSSARRLLKAGPLRSTFTP